MRKPDTSLRREGVDYFTLQIIGAAERIEELLEEIKERKRLTVAEIECGIKEGRTTGDMVIKWYIRGTTKMEQRYAKFCRFTRDGSWVHIRLYRKDGTLGDHQHMIDTADIVSFSTAGVR